ncbi:MAG: phosphatidylserine/phosphatidylglycerophosphate/cardiolipin synthase family protein [Verrucomicrobia bacterium]|nr:phosphatidylserine/phosphatidylglycerophosphate/cardiolipin synthase family protein [Verrucomicrobiota bacterium]
MNTRSALGLLGLLGLAGCASAPDAGERARWTRPAEPVAAVENQEVTAWRLGNRLHFWFAMQGRETSARAQWLDPQPGLADPQHRWAVLTFEKPTGAMPDFAAQGATPLAVRPAEQWRQLVRQVLEGLVPDPPNLATGWRVQSQHLLAYRDADRRLQVVRHEAKPREVQVVRVLADAEFSQNANQLLAANLGAFGETDAGILFATGQDPAFVFFDLRQNLTVVVHHPQDPEVSPVHATPVFVVRALNSLVIRSLALTALKNPSTLITRGLWHMAKCGTAVLNAGLESPRADLPPLASGAGMDLEAWEEDLDRMVSSRRYAGQVELLIDGDAFFPDLLAHVAAAQRSIDVLVYIFDNDDYAVQIAEVLKARSHEVRVRVLMDEMGSFFAARSPPSTPPPPGFRPPADIKSFLRAGSEVLVRTATNPWLTADHRKCIVIDGRVAYLGGMNLGREYRSEWHDLMVRLTGPITGRVRADFAKAWAHAGPLGDLAYAWAALFGPVRISRVEPPKAIDIRPLYTQTGRTDIYLAQLRAIQRAQRYIYLQNAYLAEDSISRELVRARRRGVDVRVILPAQNDLGIMETSNAVTANNLVRNGIRVYAYPGMTHVKAAIYDGWACLGSANFNKLSLHVCHELNIAFSDPATVERLRRDLFEVDFARSREITEPVALNWLDSLVETFADQL